MQKNIYNISISTDFHGFLATKFAKEFQQNPLELADVLFLMPSKRAVNSLRNAFLQVFNLRPMILPQIKAISDFDEDELFLKIDNFANIKEAINADERLFFFIKLIMAKNNITLPQAHHLAIELASLLDEANNMGLDLDNIKNIIPDNFSAHIKDMLEFLTIITQNWPHILEEQQKIDVTTRRSMLLELAVQSLVNSNQRVVIAGVSAPFVAIQHFIKTLPNKELYFYGIDMCLSEDDWQAIAPTHPSYENKQLLDFLGLTRNDLTHIGDNDEFITELMRPAYCSDKWQQINPNLASFFDNINIIEAENQAQEALIIALIIKKELEADKEIALITPDRGLSRRVCAELKRFDIEVDDTSGRPLSSTPLGSFMRLVIANATKENLINFLSLIKHPFFNNKDFVKEYEKTVLRQGKENQELETIAKEIKSRLALPQNTSLKEMLSAHIKLCQSFCDKLFVKEEGRVAATLFTNILENCKLVENVGLKDYQEFFDTILASASVRQNYNTHPKIKILGPIEARFSKFDVAIIGSCVEGMWPLAANSNPWLSDSMKTNLGLKPHAYSVGIYSFDFAAAISSKEVYITHPIKLGGSPQSKSRYLLKLEALQKLLDYKDNKKQEYLYHQYAQIINKPDANINLQAPAPTPPLSARPQEISASQIETLIKDPYQIYAKKILGLYKLDDINQEPDISDYGTIIHKILELFYKKYPTVFPLNAKQELETIGQEVFAANNFSQEVVIFWQAKLNKIIDWLIELENGYSINVAKRHSEISSSVNIGGWTIKGKADRIDELTDGTINVVDYKTGSIKSKSQIYSGYGPQLPAEGIIFEDHFKTDVSNLIYLQLGKKEARFNDDLPELFLKAKEQLLTLINAYNNKDMPYHSCIDANNLPKFSDYEHLSRYSEWAVKGDSDE